MKTIVGVDIGNSTTEACLAQEDDNRRIRFLCSASVATTGTKGTAENTKGIVEALQNAAKQAGMNVSDIDLILINEAAPVIGGTAMETVTETIITGSSMIGHNPNTPAGIGFAAGILVDINSLESCAANENYIVIVPKTIGYETASGIINRYTGIHVVGMILQSDEAVLVENRLHKQIPIIDEVARVDKLPQGKLAAIEVAPNGETVRMLSNPYGIATLLQLNAEETRMITPIAKSLIGSRSAAVIKTPGGNVLENILPSGEIYFKNMDGQICEVSIDSGAEKIMQTLFEAGEIADIDGRINTNIGNMLDRIKSDMLFLTGEKNAEIKDILAVDTLAPVLISGGLAGEKCLEKAVGVAAMVKTGKLPMNDMAERLQNEISVYVKIAGIEAVMATLGALTTPGTSLPIAVLDMGGGSTDAAVMDEKGNVRSVHLAGAGELVTLLIKTELGLNDRLTAENMKKYPLAKVESLFHIRLETGEIKFFEEHLPPRLFGGVVMLKDGELMLVEEDIPMEKIVRVRREAKRKVFVRNAIRALTQVAKDNNLRNIGNVVLVGGSAEDFEIPEMLTERFAEYRIVCGRGNIRSTEGPRNAVATGLVMSYAAE